MNKKHFSEKLIEWYHRNKRDLPWRNTTDAYKIWLSEVILQQTRVAQGMPYYEKFVHKYPTIQALANADEQEVLRLWQGLGYYSRARNMHATARFITENLEGKFPDNYIDLLTLKGIGTYTAAAIASFAFHEKVAVLDGNVYRVLARVFGETTDISGNEAKKIFIKLATDLLPNQNFDTHNQAVMEFGATQCTPAKPDCMFCVFAMECVANKTSQQQFLPVKTKKTKVRNRFFDYLVIQQGDKLLMKQRKKNDIWEGLYDFYLLENDEKLINELTFSSEEKQDDFLKSLTENKTTIASVSEPIIHILSHQKITAKFWHLVIDEDKKIVLPSNLSFYSLAEIENLPKPILVQNYLKKEHF